MEPKTTVWKLDEHTRGKHLVLRSYLNAWFPVMGQSNGRILFVDGFAGPGEYEAREPGSPLIAINSLAEHRAKSMIRAEPIFMFIEQDAERAEHLKTVVRTARASLPANAKVSVKTGPFDQTMTQVLDQLDAQAKKLAPAFVMLDPFGVSGTPMDVIQRILKNPKSEVYISFMYEAINRFKATDAFAPHLDGLFGTTLWRQGLGIEGPDPRKQFFYNLYTDQLRRAGAKYVVHFELWRENRLVYAIFLRRVTTKAVT